MFRSCPKMQGAEEQDVAEKMCETLTLAPFRMMSKIEKVNS